MELPAKVKNPKTGRDISTKGVTFLRLVYEGYFEPKKRCKETSTALQEEYYDLWSPLIGFVIGVGTTITGQLLLKLLL